MARIYHPMPGSLDATRRTYVRLRADRHGQQLYPFEAARLRLSRTISVVKTAPKRSSERTIGPSMSTDEASDKRIRPILMSRAGTATARVGPPGATHGCSAVA